MSLVSLSSYLPFLWHSRLFRQLCLVSGCVFLAEWFWVDFVHSGLVAVCCGSALKQCQKRLWLSDTVNIWTCLCSGLFKWQKLLPCFFLPPYPIFFSFTVALVAKTVREENQVWSCVVEERKKKKTAPKEMMLIVSTVCRKTVDPEKPECVNLSVWISCRLSTEKEKEKQEWVLESLEMSSWVTTGIDSEITKSSLPQNKLDD